MARRFQFRLRGLFLVTAMVALISLALSVRSESELAAFIPFYAMMAAMILGSAAVESFLE